MKPQIPWLRVFVEGVVIVGSILLAFGIDAWWDERQERQQEQVLLDGLMADFVINRDALERIIEFYENSVDRLARLERMTPEEVAELPGDSVLAFSSAIQGLQTFDARNGTLDAVIASGALSVISDLRLRDALVEWEAIVQDATEEAGQVRAAAEKTENRIIELGGPWHGGGSRDGPLPRIMQGFPLINLADLVSDAELQGSLRRKRWMAGVYLAELMPMAEHADQVMTMIDNHIE